MPSSLDTVKWEVVKQATLRRAIDGHHLGAASLRLLVSMLAHVQEQEWHDRHRLITWPSYAELTMETALSKGSIGPARQKLVAAGFAVRLVGAHKRGGPDPVAAYQIHTRITASDEQREMQQHLAQQRRR